MLLGDKPLKALLGYVGKFDAESGAVQIRVTLFRTQDALGRDFGMARNGPRPIDLDVIFYEDVRMETSVHTPLPRHYHGCTSVKVTMSNQSNSLLHALLISSLQSANV